MDSSTDADLWGNYLNSNWSSIDTILANLYPVGSLYFNASVSTNPNTLLGFGTWTAFGAGQIPIGVGSFTDGNGTSETITAGQQIGEYKHTLTTPEMPSHTHVDSGHTNPNVGIGLETNGGASFNSGSPTGYLLIGNSGTGYANLQNTGGGGSHNNIQPSIGVYIWLRTA